MKKLFLSITIMVMGMAMAIAQSTVITQWNFNGASGTTIPGGLFSPTPSFGIGTADTVGGTLIHTFTSGVGSSDTATSGNFSWNAGTYPAQGTLSGTRGYKFNVSTLGYSNLQISFDLRGSNTGPKHFQLQYTTDGTTWTPYSGAGTDTAGLYVSGASVFLNGKTADLSAITAANNNQNFSVRLVAVFAPGTSNYEATNATSNYATGGTSRVDMFTVSGTSSSTGGITVAFRVNTSFINVSSNGMHIAGSFQGFNPSGTPMTSIGNGVYEYVLQNATPGDTLKYKFINGNAWGSDESVPAACALGGDRFFVVPATSTVLPSVCFASCAPCGPGSLVTFRVDMTGLTVNPLGVHVAGNFQGWNPGGSPLASIGNNIYAATFNLPEGLAVEYKYVNGNSWGSDESVPAACANSSNNRFFTVPVADTAVGPYIFGTCSVTTITNTTPLYTINTVRGVNATTGVADSLGTVCRLSGTLYGVNQNNNGLQFVMIDATGGITMRRANGTFGLTLTQGDSIEVTGTIAQFNGLLQINVDTAILLATNRTLKSPTVTTTLGEAQENDLIRINGLSIVSGTWPAANSAATITVTNGTDNFAMRILAQTNIGGTTAPTGTFDLIGLGAQFDNSNPFTSGYQIFPRSTADIIPIVVTSPTTSFEPGNNVVGEAAGTININVRIQPAATSTGTIKVRVVNSTGAFYTTDYTTAPAPVNDTITLNVVAGDTLKTIAMTIIDDAITEPNDTVTFSIVSATAGLTIGAPSSRAIIIVDNDAVIPTYPIALVSAVNATTGVADSLGVVCKVEGIVIGVNLRGSTTGVQFSIINDNNTAGIGVFRTLALPTAYTVTEGDRIRVIGTVGQFNGLTQINTDSITLISTNNTVPAPIVTNVPTEALENRLMRINNLTIVNPASWPAPGATGSGATVRATNGTDSLDIRIDNDVTLFGTIPAPTGTFDLIGVGGQFDNSNPFTSGYQILPMRLSDLIVTSVPDTLSAFELSTPPNNTTLTVSGDGTQTVTISWTATTPSVSTDPVTYEFLLAGQTGNFNSPLFVTPSNSAGSATSLTLTYTQIADLLSSLGVAVGQTAAAKWTVRATSGNLTRLASTPFDIVLGRGIMTSTANTNLNANVNVFPNPAKSEVVIQVPENGEAVVSIHNLAGQVIRTIRMNQSTERFDISDLNNGIYLIRIEQDGAVATKKLSVVK